MMRQILLVFVLAAGLGAGPLHGQTDPLRIVVTDMEGGAGTLIVTPDGESVLIDCGSHRSDARDAKRIADAARRLGVAKIDHLVITHFHRDHWGGLGQLAERIAIERFYDHGVRDRLPEDPQYPRYLAVYRRLSAGKRRTLRPGDSIPLRGHVRLRCVASDGEVLGGGSDECRRHPAAPPDPTDNARSIALVLELARFRAFFGGDITRNVEHALVCPVNRVGEVDLYQADHHGLQSSNHPLLLERLNPTVVVMHNGKRKGGGKATMTAFRRARALEAIFQLHKSLRYPAWNVPDRFIANVAPDASGTPIVVSVTARQDRFCVRLGFDGSPVSFRIRPGKQAPVAQAPVEQP